MKKMFVIISILLGVWSCKNETRENPPLRGHVYIQANPWKFYFVDAEGNDLLRLQPGRALPVTDFNSTDPGEVFVLPEDFDAQAGDYSYNRGGNSVGYDAERGLNYWMTYVQGYLWDKYSEFYVRFTPSDTDTIRMRSEFLTEGCIGADVCPDIRDVYYNGVQVIRNGDYIQGEGIVIRKTED